MIRKIKFLSVLTLSLSFSFIHSQTAPETYISNWKDVAINQMVTSGIPASITLAQGILESGSGTSLLATKANNHFGIKCHDWNGKKFHKDDDAKNECFRKYKDASESFKDHSEFLTSRSRYAELFTLKITDYKGWARGLKKAGYATNPQYANRLIELIEKYNLNQYDIIGVEYIANKGKKNPTIKKEKSENSTKEIAVNTNKHKVFTDKNRTKYIVATEGDTFYQISKEFGLNLRQLNKYNNFPPFQDVLNEGDIIYLMKKRKKPNTELTSIKVKEEENLWLISQQYGITLDALLKKNNLESADIALKEGDIIYLR